MECHRVSSTCWKSRYYEARSPILFLKESAKAQAQRECIVQEGLGSSRLNGLKNYLNHLEETTNHQNNYYKKALLFF